MMSNRGDKTAIKRIALGLILSSRERRTFENGEKVRLVLPTLLIWMIKASWNWFRYHFDELSRLIAFHLIAYQADNVDLEAINRIGNRLKAVG